MKKHFIIICNLACLIGFFTFLLGCDQAADKELVPKVIRKKIYAQTDKKAKPRKARSATKSAPAAKPAVKRTDTDNQSSGQPLIAKKSEPSAAKTAKSRPPIKPKSDISNTRQPTAQKPGVKTDLSQQTMASTSSAEKPKLSSKMPPIYNPKGKIDPFEPLFREKPTMAMVKKKRKKRIPRTPLEKIDLSQLTLVGIILASSGNKALVEEASGKGYVIKRGTFIGTNAGKVVKVLGNVTLRNKELKLPKPPGEL
jgi:type IV pilus assembly protein PilP